MEFPIIAFIVLVLITILGVFATLRLKISRQEYLKTGKHPQGHYLGKSMGLGLVLGLPMGIAMDNIALGPAIGLPIGLAIGTAWEKQHAKELRPLTKQEKDYKTKALLMLIGTTILGLLVFFMFNINN